MTHLPPPPAPRRAPRTCFAETTPAVLRCRDGRRIPGKLQVISLTGGLLRLPKPLEQGSQVKVMFLTLRGSVLGAAEMLSPVSWRLQPFKFVELYDDDQRKLQAAIQLSLDQNRRDHGQMERHRAW
jgi:PilZ domain